MYSKYTNIHLYNADNHNKKNSMRPLLKLINKYQLKKITYQ